MTDFLFRLFNTFEQEKTKKVLAFVLYSSFILTSVVDKFPFFTNIVQTAILLLVGFIFGGEFSDTIYEKIHKNPRKNILKEIKKICKEILMFLPIYAISIFITTFVIVGKPLNQMLVEEDFWIAPLDQAITAIICAPLIEEFLCRLLPYRFIKNKWVYIIVSTVIFAGMHVIHDPNPFYYIWFYMLKAWYYGYRYYKTKDILVPISLHSFSNLIAILLLVF